MAFKLNRPTSKFNHMFAKPLKSDRFFSNIRITKVTADGTFCAANTKFLAVISEGGTGASFIVLPLNNAMNRRLETDYPAVVGHTSKVLDVKWSPFNENMIASCSEDKTTKVWLIPDSGLKSPMSKPAADLVGHQKKVTHIEWHPVAENVLMTAGMDKFVCVWNIEKPEKMFSFEFPDSFLSVGWNYNGSQIITSCKDGMIRILDARKGEMLSEWSAHPKNAMAIFLKDGRVFTTGSSRMSDRKVSVWNADDTANPIDSLDIDNCNRVLFPFYDCDTNLIYLWGKGESAIKYYEIFDKSPQIYYLSQYSSGASARGVTFMPKRGLDVTKNELARLFKLVDKSGNGVCEIIPLLVPRVADTFQDDLYPDTLGPKPQLSPCEWQIGEDAEPQLISLREKFDQQSGTTEETSFEGTSNISALRGQATTSSKTSANTTSNKQESKKASVGMTTTVVSQSSTPPPESTNQSNGEIASLTDELAKTRGELKETRDEVKSMREKMKKLETRMKMMEAKISIMEQENLDLDEAEV